MADKKRAAGKPGSSRARTLASAGGKEATGGRNVSPPKAVSAAATARPKKTSPARPVAKRGPKASARSPRAGASGRPPQAAKGIAESKKVGKPKALAPRRKREATAKAPMDEAALAGAGAGLSEEDTIRSAKYLPRNLPPRLFEEERFLFPESYGIDRIRLLVRDPEWLFAYWDVSPKSFEDLRRELGDRAAAVARLTLRIADPVSGGASDVLLPPGARWWYVRADSARRSYRAELGFTLASGEFRTLARSNTVTTPRVGPSTENASRRLSYRQAGEIPPAAGAAVRQEEMRSGAGNRPWDAPNVDGTTEAPAPSAAPASSRGDRPRKGGASDAYRPGGASDVHRR
jgi:Domain of unknown function (DUF4912)